MNQVHAVILKNARSAHSVAIYVKTLLVKITDRSICQNFATSNFCTIQYNIVPKMYVSVQVTSGLVIPTLFQL